MLQQITQKITPDSNISSYNHSELKPWLLFLFAYGDSAVQDKIFDVKKCTPDAVRWAVDHFLKIILGNITDCSEKNMSGSTPEKVRIGLVPIPSRGYYRREKDHDHMYVVAREMKKKTLNNARRNVSLHVLDCLIPLSLSQQKTLSKEAREDRQEHMFVIDPVIKLIINRKKYTHIWILDDVITTGSTLLSASTLVAKQINHKRIFAVGLAH